jgi:hypothetical protein
VRRAVSEGRRLRRRVDMVMNGRRMKEEEGGEEEGRRRRTKAVWQAA